MTYAAEAPPSVPVADRVVGVVLLVVFALLAAVLTFVGLMLAFMSDSCGTTHDCNTGLIGLGMLITMAMPWVCWLATLVLLAVWVARGKRVWWLPLAGAGLALLAAAVGFGTAYVGAA